MKTTTHNTKKSGHVPSSSVIKGKLVMLLTIVGILVLNTTFASGNDLFSKKDYNTYSGTDSAKKAVEGTPVKKQLATNRFAIVYRVQIISLAGCLPPNAAFFKKCGHAAEYIINDQYIYTIGEFKTNEEALKASDELRKKGYSDAFPVAFINKHKVTTEEAFAVSHNK